MGPADLKPADLRPAGLISKMQKTQGPFAQKGLRPPAGTPRRHMCGFHHACQQKYPSGLKNPCLFRGPRRGLQGPKLALLRLWCGSGSGQPPKRPPRGSQEAPTRLSRGTKRLPRGSQEAPKYNFDVALSSIRPSCSSDRRLHETGAAVIRRRRSR